MELREVNPNINSAHNGQKKVSATFIQPPRSAAVNRPSSLPAAATASAPKVSYTGGAAPPAETPYGYSPEEMLAMAEASYAECPCPTCAYYRAYYTAQVGGTTMAVAVPVKAPSIVPRSSFSSGSIPLMTVRSTATPAPAGPVYADPSLYEGPSTMMNLPRASPRLPRASLPSSSPMDTFQTHCEGRVLECACSAEGKSVLQSLIRTQHPEVLEQVVAEITEDLEVVALDPNGCHVVRAVVECCTPEQTATLVAAMHETLILNMATVSQYTRRILQSLFERQLVDLSGVVDVLAPNASYLAATQQGCIALMRVYEQCDEVLKARLIETLLPLFSYIALDPFGNYVVQCAIENSGEAVAARYTLRCFAGRLLPMSCDKYASNVVEKVIRTCGQHPSVRRLLLDELIYNPASVEQMVNDGYGNFVVQSIIDSNHHPAELKRISERLRPALSGSPYAARIEGKLKAKKGVPPVTHHYPHPASHPSSNGLPVHRHVSSSQEAH